MSGDGEHERLAHENRQLRQRLLELERATAENADAAHFLASVLQAVPAFIMRADEHLRLRYLNRYQPGHTPEQALGRSIQDYIAPADWERARAVCEHTLRTGEPGRFENVAPGAHGEPAVYETHVAAVREPNGRYGLCLVALEVTQHRRREQALSEVQDKLRVALESTGLGLWSWDVERNEVVWDEAMCRLHGYDTPRDLKQYVEEQVHPLDREEFVTRAERVLASGRWDAAPYRIVRPDGQMRWILSSGRVVTAPDGTVVRLMGGSLDVTAVHELENQLRQAQKMEALGNLTAGIAHNFNNMLAVIMPTLELATPLVRPDRQPLLREAAHAARRASELVRQMMTFAGRAPSETRAPHAVAQIVDAAVGICRRAFDRRIALDTGYDGAPATVVCNAGQLEQVIVNLLLNARDAVLGAGRGRGRVHVRVETRDRHLPPLVEQGAPRRAVAIEISDDGVGMNEEVQNRAFEPFFSTKPVGSGTGLGLATSYAIVRDHQGTLTCRSEPAVGTTFTITLPLSSSAQTAAVARAPEPLPPGLCVLLVDDDAAVRAAIGQVLAGAGLRVFPAASGAEALLALERHSDVDVVLLDRSMPDGTGDAFVLRMRKAAPRARILFFTGHALEPEVAALADGVVHKPVHGRELIDAIRSVLTG